MTGSVYQVAYCSDDEEKETQIFYIEADGWTEVLTVALTKEPEIEGGFHLSEISILRGKMLHLSRSRSLIGESK